MTEANEDMLKLASKDIKKLFDKMVDAGFTDKQAMDYLSSLMAKIVLGKKLFQKYNKTEQFVSIGDLM